MARCLKFQIQEAEGLYYLCSENKGADQLRGYREADLRLCFRICKNRFSHVAAHLFCSVLDEDVNLYKSRLEAETSITATSLLLTLTHVSTNLTQLFDDALYELTQVRNSSHRMASNISDDTKSKLRSVHV